MSSPTPELAAAIEVSNRVVAEMDSRRCDARCLAWPERSEGAGIAECGLARDHPDPHRGAIVGYPTIVTWFWIRDHETLDANAF